MEPSRSQARAAEQGSQHGQMLLVGRVGCTVGIPNFVGLEGSGPHSIQVILLKPVDTWGLVSFRIIILLIGKLKVVFPGPFAL